MRPRPTKVWIRPWYSVWRVNSRDTCSPNIGIGALIATAPAPSIATADFPVHHSIKFFFKKKCVSNRHDLANENYTSNIFTFDLHFRGCRGILAPNILWYSDRNLRVDQGNRKDHLVIDVSNQIDQAGFTKRNQLREGNTFYDRWCNDFLVKVTVNSKTLLDQSTFVLKP